uniref:PH domain-containing protein n=1 Tax=Macrostomum lignano TaxID=282301 RepID=A0A1I8FGI8_9PLAT
VRPHGSDRPFVPLPLPAFRAYASIGLPAQPRRALPSRGPRTILRPAPWLVSLQLLRWTSAADAANAATGVDLFNQTYQRLGVDIPCACRVAEILRDGVCVPRRGLLLFKEDTMLVYFVRLRQRQYMSLRQD